MTNITIAEGGGVVANGVISHLPACTATSYSSLSLEEARSFDITSSDYLVSLIPTIVPGLIFGILSALGFIFFSIWLCTQCCGMRPKHRKQRSAAAAWEQSQFISSSEQQSSEYAAGKKGWRQSRWAQPGFLLKVLLALLALAVAGVSGWGMAVSLKATSSTFTDLWDIMEDIESRVSNATSALTELDRQLTLLNGNVTQLANRTTDVQAVVGLMLDRLVQAGALGVNQQQRTWLNQGLNQAVEKLLTVPDQITGIQAGIRDGLSTMQDTLQKELQVIEDSFKPPTLAFEETWRFIPIAVVFGTTLAIALPCAALFWRLKWYRTATLVTAVLWFDVALLMLLGVGLLNGVSTLSGDSCKYAEFLSLVLVQRKVKNPKSQELILNALKYYFGLTAIPDSQVVDQLMGVPTYQLHEFVTPPLVQLADNMSSNLSPADVQQAALATQLPFDAVYNSLLMMPNMSDTLWRLESQALKSSIDPLYHSTKAYICCTLDGNVKDIFAAWTAAGVLGFTLALLCSWRLARHALTLRKLRWRAMAAAASASAGGLHELEGTHALNGSGYTAGPPQRLPDATAFAQVAAGKGAVGEDKAGAAGMTGNCELAELPVSTSVADEMAAPAAEGFVVRPMRGETDAPPTPPAALV